MVELYDGLQQSMCPDDEAKAPFAQSLEEYPSLPLLRTADEEAYFDA